MRESVAPDLVIYPMLAMVNIRPGHGMLTAVLEGLVRVNEILLADRHLPPLYASGVRYSREVDTERWLTCEQVYAEREGDCEDLACWRVGELRRAGDRATVIVTASRKKLYHVRVRRQDGSLEDPSRVLGMRGRNG